jgi:hypothetical protein
MDGSDWVHLDPSGVDLERAWKETLAEFGADAEFERIGLTPQQVEQFDLARFAIARSKAIRVATSTRRCTATGAGNWMRSTRRV